MRTTKQKKHQTKRDNTKNKKQEKQKQPIKIKENTKHMNTKNKAKQAPQTRKQQ